MTQKIYKLLTLPQWDAFKRSESFIGAPIDKADGYIHFSAADQAVETANKHFAGFDVVILARCDAAGFGQQLKWEVSRGGALFPHLYAALPLGAVERYWTVTKKGDRFAFPDTY